MNDIFSGFGSGLSSMAGSVGNALGSMGKGLSGLTSDFTKSFNTSFGGSGIAGIGSGSIDANGLAHPINNPNLNGLDGLFGKSGSLGSLTDIAGLYLGYKQDKINNKASKRAADNEVLAANNAQNRSTKIGNQLQGKAHDPSTDQVAYS